MPITGGSENYRQHTAVISRRAYIRRPMILAGGRHLRRRLS